MTLISCGDLNPKESSKLVPLVRVLQLPNMKSVWGMPAEEIDDFFVMQSVYFLVMFLKPNKLQGLVHFQTVFHLLVDLTFLQQAKIFQLSSVYFAVYSASTYNISIRVFQH